MFVGHGFLAFALAAGLARVAGAGRERALMLGLLAGAFGLTPDVDIAYALVGLAGAEGAMDAATGFWAASTRIHRAVTHSFVVGAVGAVAAGGVAAGDRRRYVGAVLLAVLVAVAAVVSGALGAGVVALFAAAVGALAAAGRRAGLGARGVAAAAAVGLLSHPPGDLLTGEPPAFLYPFDATLVAARPALTPDPTLNLLAPLFVELATAWLAVGVALWVVGGVATGPLASLRRRLQGRAALGVGFAGFAALAPAPTLDVSYHFVFPLLGVGLAAAAPVPAVEASSLADLRAQAPTLAVTGLAAVTVAAAAYAVAYLAGGV